jgi:hypothetical protein
MVAPSMATRELGPCTEWTYVAHAVIHPASLFIVVAAILLVASHLSVGAVALGLGVEAAFLVVAPRWGVFRRAVQRSLTDEERAARRRVRDALVLEMGEVHRAELAHIDELLAEALANAERRGAAVTLGARDAHAMARLTLGYIHLAVHHERFARALAMTHPDALHATIRWLEDAVAIQPPEAHATLRRRLVIAVRRAERWRETRASLETCAQQLATIAELACLVHQESLAASNQSLSAEVDRVLADFEHGDHAAREVASMNMIDPDVIDVEHALIPT